MRTGMGMFTTWDTGRKMIAAAALALVVLTACGDAQGGGGVATLGDGQANEERREVPDNPQDAYVAFAECMRAEGIEDYEPPEVDEEGRTEESNMNQSDSHTLEELNAAEKQCQYLLENATVTLDDEDAAALDDAMLEYTKCMRKEGIPLPDPTPGTGALIDGEREQDDPDFAAANDECKDLLDVVPE
jgi:hypothetical protein